MTTLAAAAQARADQAASDLMAAEMALLSIARTMDPRLAVWPPALVLTSRLLESRLEQPRIYPALAAAHFNWCRARRAAAKARSAANMARHDMRAASGAAKAPGLTATAVLEGLRELRAA